MMELLKEVGIETILGILFVFIGFPALIILLPQKNDGRVTMNNMPGSQDHILTDEEKDLMIRFRNFLSKQLNVDFRDSKCGEYKIDLRPTNYNVGPGYRGVVKRKNGKEWIYYTIGEWKKLEREEKFATQLEAYQFLAKEVGLEFVGDEDTNN